MGRFKITAAKIRVANPGKHIAKGYCCSGHPLEAYKRSGTGKETIEMYNTFLRYELPRILNHIFRSQNIHVIIKKPLNEQ